MAGSRLRVAILDDFEGWFKNHREFDACRTKVDLTVFETPMADEDSAARALADFDGICLIRERTPFPSTLIARLPKLRYLSFTGARNPSCDHAAAAARDIPVSNTPGGPSKRSTAELAFALAMSASKRLACADAGTRAGHWRADANGDAYTLPLVLEGRTMGLLGLGEIGQIMAGYARAFGMHVIAWSPNLTPERASQGGAEWVGKHDLFRRADVVSLHLVLSAQTRGIVGAAELAAMQEQAILVNTSRAGLIDQHALIEALTGTRPGHFALDVFNTEPLSASDPLAAYRHSSRLTFSPHLGYVNDSVFDAFARGLGEVIESWAKGEPVRVMNGVGS